MERGFRQNWGGLNIQLLVVSFLGEIERLKMRDMKMQVNKNYTATQENC